MDFDQLESQNKEISPVNWRNEAVFEDNIIPNTAIDFGSGCERRSDYGHWQILIWLLLA